MVETLGILDQDLLDFGPRGIGLFAQNAFAQTLPAQPRIPTLTLTGEGSAEAVPELVTVQIGVAVTAVIFTCSSSRQCRRPRPRRRRAGAPPHG